MHPSGSTTRRGQGLSLIGYRASGKTTVARLVAEMLDRPFLDADREIARRAGVTVAEIFASEGEGGFRDREEAAIRDLCEGYPGAVLATGGGAILRPENRVRLREFGLVAWLSAPVSVLVDRLRRDPAARPSLTSAGLLDEVQTVLQAREPLYRESADLIVDASPDDPSRVAEAIIRQLARPEGCR